MTSPLEAYLRDNEKLREMDRGKLIDELYQTSGVEESREQFERKLVTNPETTTFADRIQAIREAARSPQGVREGAISAYENLPSPTDVVTAGASAVKGLAKEGAKGLADAGEKAMDAIGGIKPLWWVPEWVGKHSIFKNLGEEAIKATKTPGEVWQNPSLMTDPKTGQTSSWAIERAAELAGMAILPDAAGRAVAAAAASRKAGFEARLPKAQDWRPPPDPRIVAHPERTPGELTNFVDRVYYKFLDEFGAFNKLEKQVTGHWAGSSELLAEESVYKLIRLTNGNAGRMQHWIEHGTVDFNNNTVIGPGLKQVLEPITGPQGKDVGNLKSAVSYAVAKRTIEKEAQGIKTGNDLAAARKTVNDVETAAATKPEAAAFVKFQKDLVQYNKDMLKYLADSGVISGKQFDAITAANMDYVPFYRLMDSNISQAAPGKKSLNPIKAMKGGEQEILDPIESIIRNTYAFIQIAERNRAGQALWRLITQGGEKAAQFGREVPYQARPIDVAGAEIQSFLQKHGVQTDTPEAFTIFRRDSFRPKSDEIIVMIDGKKKLLQVDPELRKAWDRLDKDQVNAFVKVLAYPASMLRAGVTLDPGFALRNVFRDQFAPLATAPGGYIPFYDAALGLGSVLGGKEHYWEWMRSGGAGATRVAVDEAYANVAKYKIVGGTMLEGVGRKADSVFSGLREMTNLFENATRVGNFQRLRAQGYDALDAAYISRELTVDFARMGSAMREMNMIVAFMNPSMQGVERVGRAIISNPGTANLGLLGITMGSLGLWSINHNDPRYKQMPRWQKDIYWPIFFNDWQDIGENEVKTLQASVPTRDATVKTSSSFDESGFNEFLPTEFRQLPSGRWQANFGKALLLPKPFEIGVFYASVLGERVPEWYITENPDAWKNVVKSLQRAFLPPIMPTALTPWLEIESNYSYFFERPIISQSLMRELPELRYTAWTSETGKAFASLMRKMPGLEEVSGAAVDHWIRNWTGTLGNYTLEYLTDPTLRATGLAPPKIAPEKTVAEMPVLRSFTTRHPTTAAQSIRDFYEAFTKQQQVVTSVRTAGTLPDGDEIQSDIASKHGIAKINENYNALNKLNRMIQDVVRTKKMSPEEKRAAIDYMTFQMIAIATDGNKKIEAAKKRGGTPKSGWLGDEDLDQRKKRFETADNKTQQKMLSSMRTIWDQMAYAHYAHKETKEEFMHWFRLQTADHQITLMEPLTESDRDHYLPIAKPEAQKALGWKAKKFKFSWEEEEEKQGEKK